MKKMFAFVLAFAMCLSLAACGQAKEKTYAVEAGSAGEEAAAAEGFDYIPVDTQAKAVMEVASGNSDACIIDLLMAGAIALGIFVADLINDLIKKTIKRKKVRH